MRALLLLAPFLLAAAARPKPEPAPPAAAPEVALEIVAPAADAARWKLRVVNKGSVPLRLAADARLLSFEIEPDATPGATETPKKPKPVTCALPADMRPAGDDERVLVLPPGRAFGETFDPQLYCFGATESAALRAGGRVTARMGFSPGRGKLERPFVISPFDGIEPRVAAAKEIAAPSFTLAALAPAAPPAASAPLTGPRLSVALPEWLDANRGAEAAGTVTVSNAGDRPVTLRLRPDTVTFSVATPGGASVRCGRGTAMGTPVRELFDTVPARGSAALPVLLAALCPAATFDQAGLYRVVPTLDTRRASGERIGLATFDGEVVGTRASLLRVRAAQRHPPIVRPSLE
jgi:hypothetical protein